MSLPLPGGPGIDPLGITTETRGASLKRGEKCGGNAIATHRVKGGLPCLAVPTSIHDNVPIGVQLVAARFREDLWLDAGEAIEARAKIATQIDPQ